MADPQSNAEPQPKPEPKPEPDPQPHTHERKPGGVVPEPIRNGSDRVMMIGAGFGAIVLIGFFVIVYLAANNERFICNTFLPLAAIFAFGAALSGAFMGGSAAAQGKFGGAGERFSFAFGLGGGAAFFVITFLLFTHFRPSCPEKQAELKFQDVLGMITFRLEDEFWRKEKPDSNLSGFRMLAVRAEEEPFFGSIDIVKDNRVICSVGVHMGKGHERLSDARRLYALETIEFQKWVALKFNDEWWGRWNANAGSVKAISPDCFKVAQNKKPVHGMIAIDLRHDTFYYASASNVPPDTAGEEVPTPKTKGTNYFGIASAFAAGPPANLSFPELKALLNSSGADVRVEARRYLGENFERYKDDALRDLFDPSSSSDYLIGLLHGLIAGTDKATQYSKLAFGEPDRDLGKEVPYIQDRYADIVKLTGHPDDGVRKQARRLIQRFPVSHFGQYFAALEAQARASGCKKVKIDTSLQGQLYASIFYNYNRIAQFLSHASLSDEDIKKIEETSRIGFEMAECLDDDLLIDVQSLNYAKFVTYGNFSATKTLANGYAKEFVRKAEGTDYYSPSHVEVAKRFIATADKKSAEPLSTSQVGR